jgi:hypothetical protein
VRGRADELDDTALDIRQQNVLLRLVEAMNFVNEQNCGLTFVSTPLKRSNLLLVWRAMICASDVLPVPGGP